MDMHIHHFVPKPTVGGVLTCSCGATHRGGQVIPPPPKPPAGSLDEVWADVERLGIGRG